MNTRLPRIDLSLGAAALSGVLYAIAQPELGGWPLAAVCLVPLLRSWQAAGLGRRVWLSFVCGSIATGLSTFEAGALGVASYFGVPWWVGAVTACAVGLVLGAGCFALFALLSGDPRRHRAPVWALRVGAALVAAELVRSTLFGGLPWILLAYSLAPVPELAQSASLGGVYLVSLWLAALNAAFALASLRTRRRAALATAMLVCVGVYAAHRLAGAGPAAADAGEPSPGAGSVARSGSARPAGAVRIASLQSGLREMDRSASTAASPALERLAELSRAEPVPDLVIWPENAVSSLLPLNEHRVRRSLERLPSATAHVVVGAPRADPTTPGILSTSAFLLGPDRRVVAYHDKVRLLPFAETSPWPLSMLDASSSTRAAARPTVLQAGSIGVGPMICYEVLFPELARSLARDGAQVLINLSNDSWFGASGAADQHLASAVFRAIETRRPVVRSTLNGITAAIDARGRIVGRLERDVPGALVVDLHPGSRLTPYVRTGDAVAWSCLVGTSCASLLEALAVWRRRRSSGLVRNAG